MTSKQKLAMLGKPEEVARELAAFSQDAQLLSSKREHLIARYEGKWVAIFDREVRETANSLAELMRQIDELGLPRSSTIVRYIDKNQRTLILSASC